MLDAQQYQERPTVRGWLHDKVSKFVYGCTSSAENKTAEVLQHEAREKEKRKAQYEKTLAEHRRKKSLNVLSLQNVTTSFESFIAVDTVFPEDKSIQKLYHEYEHNVTHCASNSVHEYSQVMEHRAKALQQSCQQPVITTKNFSCDAQTAGCMQAYGVDVHNFLQVQGLPICHQITQELVDIFTGISKLHHHQLADSAALLQLCGNIVQAAQQDNVDNNFVQALQSADCSHGLLHYIQGCYRNGVDTIEQMLTASAYFNNVIDSYGFDCAVAAAQGYLGATVLEAAVMLVLQV